MEKLYKSAKTKEEADCGSDYELLIAKFRLKLKKAGKTKRSLRYDLNQIKQIQRIRSNRQSAGRTTGGGL